jgi:hypothetical protein
MAIYTGSVGVENIELAAFMQRFRGAYGSPNFLCVESICYRVRILARQITYGRYPVEEPENFINALKNYRPIVYLTLRPIPFTYF